MYHSKDISKELRAEIKRAQLGFAALADVPAFASSVRLAKAVNIYTTTIPDRFAGHADQLHRSAVSVVANIAEAQGRRTDAQLLQYTRIAAGSCYETLALLLIGEPLPPDCLVELARDTVRLLDALVIELAENRL